VHVIECVGVSANRRLAIVRSLLFVLQVMRQWYAREAGLAARRMQHRGGGAVATSRRKGRTEMGGLDRVLSVPFGALSVSCLEKSEGGAPSIVQLLSTHPRRALRSLHTSLSTP
jgi:hypothetical protein